MANDSKVAVEELSNGSPEMLHSLLGRLQMFGEQEQFEKEMVGLLSIQDQKEGDFLNQYNKLRKKGAFVSTIATLAGALTAGAMGFLTGRRKENWGKTQRTAVTVGSSVAGASFFSFFASVPTHRKLADIRKQVLDVQGKQAEVLARIMEKYARMAVERLNTPDAVEKLAELGIADAKKANNIPPAAVAETPMASAGPSTQLSDVVAVQAIPQQAKTVAG